MTTLVSRFLADESGATALEYSLIGSLIAIAIVVGAGGIGLKLNGMLGSAASQIPTVN